MSWIGVAVVLSAITAAFTAYTAIESGKAAEEASEKKAAAEYQAAVKQNEANASAAWREQLRHEAAEASQRVAFNVSGVASLPGDTVELVLKTSAGYNAMDEEAIRATGEARVESMVNQANTSLYTGEQTLKASYRQAGSSLLTGAASVVSAYNSAASSDKLAKALKGQ